MQIRSNGLLLSDTIIKADNFFLRFRGLMLKENIDKGSGMFFPDCNWIHTFFMNFAIDVIYLDASYRIVEITENIKPWRFCKPYWSARHVLEFMHGTVNDFSLKTGGVLECID